MAEKLRDTRRNRASMSEGTFYLVAKMFGIRREMVGCLTPD